MSDSNTNQEEEDKQTSAVNSPTQENAENSNLTTSQSAPSQSTSISISDLKILHFKELAELRNQLDEVRTRATIIETTKQDELDEIKFKTSQEIDSLNHIINALQNDLSQIRNEYENLSINYKELKKQHNHVIHQQQQQFQMQQAEYSAKSPMHTSSSSTSVASRLALSPFGHSNSNAQHGHNISLENENLEEDMRKAKESADMLRAVVLPLETEINTLRSRSNTSEKRIEELEKIIEQNDKEKKEMQDEENKIMSELLNSPHLTLEQIEMEEEQLLKAKEANDKLIKKYVHLKRYLKKNENRFIELEQANLKAIKQVYSLLNQDQKLRLIPNRPKSRSSTVSSQTKSTNDKLNSEPVLDDADVEKNEIISKIEELIDYLTSNPDLVIVAEQQQDASKKDSHDKSIISTSSNEQATSANPSQIFSYAELLALFEKEKDCRIDIETNFHQKAKESNRQIENLNREMSNLASIIEDLRKQYVTLQNQYQFQLDSLIKVNEEIRNDIHQIEMKNEKYKAENLRLKAENKQFYGEQTIIGKEMDESYQAPATMEEAVKQIQSLRSEIVKLVLANQALNKQVNLSSESIKHLQKLNMQYQRSNTMQDQLVITQSLESELERERKVRVEAENEKQEVVSQLKLIKEKGQSLVESLKQRNDQNEFEIRKLKEDNQELLNQIASLKKDSKNNLSVQEDLVKLIQSLQIELNQVKLENDPNKDSFNNRVNLEVRLQHEDDFNDCASCKSVFSVTKRKHRCKHCCKIFCSDCCAKTVLSGPNLRPHKVCDSCHTLLDKDSKPLTSNNATSTTTNAN